MGITSKHSNDIPKKVLYLLFHLIGIFLAFYFVTKQVLQYQKNDDKSSFFFKRYHTTPEDRYPTFSICFSADLRYPGTLYQDDVLNDTLAMDPSDYMNMLTGFTTGPTNFSILQFDEAKWDLRIMLNTYSMSDYRRDELQYWNTEGWEMWQAPFFPEYQDSAQLCITRNDTFDLKSMIYAEFVNLDTTNWIGTLYLYLHYPGQLMTQMFYRPTLSLELSEQLLTNSYSVVISQLQTLRKRPDSLIRCNPDHDSNLDMRWRESIMTTANCIPTYWKFLNQSTDFTNMKFNEGRKASYKEYSNLNDILSGYNELKYDQSCTWPTIITHSKPNLSNTTYSNLIIEIFHESEYYLEIRNSKEINSHDLWSQIGGLIGIFLGYSLLQIPSAIFRFLTVIKNCRHSLKKRCVKEIV